MTPIFFPSALHFRAWLEQNHSSAKELLVGFRKVGSGNANMSWSDSVDEALCFGWIDGVRKRIDEQSYQIRFTPRRSSSIWSSVNLTKIQTLMAQGRMRPAGISAYEARREDKISLASFERTKEAQLALSELRSFKAQRAAWNYFEATAPSYQRTIKHWIVSAKQEATRARRLEQLIQACTEQRRLLK